MCSCSSFAGTIVTMAGGEAMGVPWMVAHAARRGQRTAAACPGVRARRGHR
jgi:hypothetical protein